MTLRLSILLFLVLSAAPVFAKNDQVRKGPAPDWAVPSEAMEVPANAAGLVFVRRQDSLIHLDGQGQAFHNSYRFKLLHSTALQLGNLSVSWDPSAGSPIFHEIKVYRGAETIDILPNAKFEVLRREDQLEAARLDGILTAVFRVEDLRVGDELEVSLTTHSNDPTLGNRNSGMLTLLPEPSPGRFRLGISWETGQKPTVKMTDDMKAASSEGDRRIEFRFDNPAAKQPPKDAPPRYNWQRLVEFSDFSDWAEISRQLGPLFFKAAKLKEASPLKREAGNIAAAHASKLERVQAALKLVQQDVRYIYVGFNGGNLTPAGADETWQRRYGDCKGKTVLLLSLLAELGVEAEAVLVSNAGMDDGLNERLPNTQLFDHVLVRAFIDGKAYWLDGTLPPVALPSLSPFLPYRWVLPLSAKGSAPEPVEWASRKHPDDITLFELDARPGFDKSTRIVRTGILRGVKGLAQHFRFSLLSSSQLLDSLRREMVGDFWQTVDEVQWRYDLKSQASILTVVGTGKLDWDEHGNGEKSLTLPGGGFSPPERRVRPMGQNDDAPFFRQPEFDCNVTTVRLPSSTKPNKWSFNTSFNTRIFGMNYYRAFANRDGAIRMVRGFRVEKPEIEASSVQRDNDRIPDFDNSMARISYEPGTGLTKIDDSNDVPATYDVDWVTNDSACLSPSTTR